jgi:hypothetical protein
MYPSIKLLINKQLLFQIATLVKQTENSKLFFGKEPIFPRRGPYGFDKTNTIFPVSSNFTEKKGN